jgi:hypothetical protein
MPLIHGSGAITIYCGDARDVKPEYCEMARERLGLVDGVKV